VAGAHRKPGSWVSRALAVHLLMLFAVLVLPLAVLGGLAFEVVAGTSLEQWSVLGLLQAAVVVSTFWSPPRGRGAAVRYVLLYGLLVNITWEIIDALAHHLGWSAGPLHTLAVIGTWERRAGVVVASISLVLLVWFDVTGWLRRRAAPS
jgi:hypothetical protein